MQEILMFAGIIALVWGILKLSAPWRKYHAEHIAPLEKELASTQSHRTDKERARSKSIANAQLFTRDFKAEVLQHQKAKNAAYERLDPLRNRKAELHKEIDDVRYRLDRWHKSSKSFLGNKSQKIKDDSILGWFRLEQTVAQKKSLESRRNSIFSEIGDVKEEMASIFEQQINPSKKGIKAAFDDQKPLKRFLEEGLSEQTFRIDVKKLESEIANIDSKILHLKAEISKAYKMQRRSHIS